MDEGFAKPAGYAHFVRKYGLRVLPHWHESAIRPGGAQRTEAADGRVSEFYPAKYWPGDELGVQGGAMLNAGGRISNIPGTHEVCR
ncbi:MAG TPA: hypothetical protein VLJ39_22895 [Tepidisphaeraceae bacterium]|nr:hypothetical protein [Tepidisphaeraceae bacterium]